MVSHLFKESLLLLSGASKIMLSLLDDFFNLFGRLLLNRNLLVKLLLLIQLLSLLRFLDLFGLFLHFLTLNRARCLLSLFNNNLVLLKLPFLTYLLLLNRS